MKFYAEKLCLDEKDLANSPALCIAAYEYYMTCARLCISILTQSFSVYFKGVKYNGHGDSSSEKRS